MLDANVGATERVLDAAIAAGVPRIVDRLDRQRLRQHARPGRRRDLRPRPRRRLHELPTTRRSGSPTRPPSGGSRAGAPIVIAQPGTVYGPRDHSGLGQQLEAAYLGTAPFIGLGDVGISPCHVDDVAAGHRRGARPRPARRGIRPRRPEHAPRRRDAARGQGRRPPSAADHDARTWCCASAPCSDRTSAGCSASRPTCARSPGRRSA